MGWPLRASVVERQNTEKNLNCLIIICISIKSGKSVHTVQLTSIGTEIRGFCMMIPMTDSSVGRPPLKDPIESFEILQNSSKQILEYQQYADSSQTILRSSSDHLQISIQSHKSFTYGPRMQCKIRELKCKIRELSVDRELVL